MRWFIQDLASLVLARLRRGAGRATLATLGVALGAGLLVGLLSIAQGIQDEAEASAVWLASPGRLTVTGGHLQDPDVSRLAYIEGVAAALPVLATPLSVDGGGHHLIGVAGLGSAPNVAPPYRVVAGHALDASQTNTIVVSRSASDALGFEQPSDALGTTLILSGTPSTRREVVISGVADELGDQNAIVDLSLAEDMLGTQQAIANRLAASLIVGARAVGLDRVTYAAVLVIPKNVSEVPRLAQRLRASGYALAQAGTVPPALDRTFRMLQTGLGSLGLLATLGAALGVAQVLASRTAERTAEIGLLKALGATDTQVAQLICVEALVIGLAGGLLGVLLGWLGAHGIGSVAQVVFGPLPTPRSLPAILAVTPFLTTLLALLAAALPAARAWRLQPADALRTAIAVAVAVRKGLSQLQLAHFFLD